MEATNPPLKIPPTNGFYFFPISSRDYIFSAKSKVGAFFTFDVILILIFFFAVNLLFTPFPTKNPYLVATRKQARSSAFSRKFHFQLVTPRYEGY